MPVRGGNPGRKLRSATRAKIQEIIRLEQLDKTAEEIGAMVGMKAGTVTHIMAHPDYRAQADEYASKLFGPVDQLIQQRKANQVLEEAAPDAALALVQMSQEGEDEMIQFRASTAILDRSGYGPIQRRAVKVRHELDPVTAKLIGNALREADNVIEAEVVDSDS